MTLTLKSGILEELMPGNYNTELLDWLDEKMVLYKDLKSIESKENGEEFVLLAEDMTPYKNLLIFQAQLDNEGNVQCKHIKRTWLRKGVVDKLLAITKTLSKRNNGYKLKIVYGYRSLATQTKLFEHFKKKLESQYTGEELMEQIHKNIAVPEVSGHPTGGAIDVCLVDENDKDLDYGTRIWEFDKTSYTFNPFISREAWFNRQYLRSLMVDHNFAPFDGEWWHFSYGDREWAFYYHHSQSLYTQKELPNG